MEEMIRMRVYNVTDLGGIRKENRVHWALFRSDSSESCTFFCFLLRFASLSGIRQHAGRGPLAEGQVHLMTNVGV